MKTIVFDSRDEWLQARVGRITGTKLKDIIVKRGTGKKAGYYQLIAERMTVDDGISLDPMERGTYFEEEALDTFAEAVDKEVDKRQILWTRKDEPNIACSPDGVIGKTEAVEVKCLGSGRHIEALLTGEVPKEYMEQAIQYFIVNDKLKTLYVVFYDPRLIAKNFFFHTLKRKDVKKEIAEYLEYQRTTLKEVEGIVADLTGF